MFCNASYATNTYTNTYTYTYTITITDKYKQVRFLAGKDRSNSQVFVKK